MGLRSESSRIRMRSKMVYSYVLDRRQIPDSPFLVAIVYRNCSPSENCDALGAP